MSRTSRTHTHSLEGITYPHVEEYLQSLLRERPEPLRRMEKQAEREGIPIIGPTVAPLLTLIASLSHSKQILEIGTAIGYSTIWWALAVRENKGLVTTLEIDRERADQAEANVHEAGLSNYVKIIRGDAMKNLSELHGPFDLIFIDTAKDLYLRLLDLSIKKLRQGGIIMADNVLWSGLVAEEAVDEVADLMREFNKRLYSNPQLRPVILPFRDGIAIAEKTS